MAVVFKNNAKTTLASGINSSVTSISVSAGSLLPSLTGSDFFFATIDDGTKNEIVKVTARSSNTLTVVRAQDNTTAQSFSTGAVVELRLTAAILELFSQTGVAITDEIEAYLDANGLTFPDNVKAQFGANNDLQIFHNGTVSNIKDAGTGILQLTTNGDAVQIYDTANFTTMARFNTGGAVTLNHASTQRFQTTATGINVDGTTISDAETAFSTTANTPNASLIVGNTASTSANGNYKGAVGFARGSNTTQVRSAIVGKQTHTSANRQGLAFLVHPDTVAGTLNEALLINHDSTASFSGALQINGTTVIDSSRNLTNIGTISSGALSVTSDTSSFIRNSTDNDLKFTFVTNNSSDFAQLIMAGKDGGSEKFMIAYGSSHSSTPNMLALKSNDNNSGSVGFFTNSAERGRFDTVGKLLIGKTSGDTTNTVGHELKPNGIAVHTSDGTGTLFLNRKTSHGNIIELRKDNSAVGVIGTQNWGIGTSSPSEALHVVGNILTSGGVKVGDSSADALHFQGILKQGSGSGTTVMDSSRNLTNIGTISSGGITSSGGFTSSHGTSFTSSEGDGTAFTARNSVFFRIISPNVESGHTTKHEISGGWTTDGTRTYYAPKNDGTFNFNHEYGYNFAEENWYFEDKLKVGNLNIGSTNVIDSSKNLVNIGTISSGAISSTGLLKLDYTNPTLTFRPDNSAHFNIKANESPARLELGHSNNKNLYLSNTGSSTFNYDLNVVSNFKINGTTVIDSSRNLTNIGTIGSGAITSTGTIKSQATSGTNRGVELSINGEIAQTSSDASYLHIQRYHDGRVAIGNDSSSFLYVKNYIDVVGGYRLNNTEIVDSSRNLTNIGTITSGDITIADAPTPVLTLSDTNNGGGGGASGMIKFKNSSGDAMGIGYTANVVTDSDMIISTNAGGTYGGYLGLDANGITDAQSDIILEPKTNVRIATGSIEMGTTVFIDQNRNLTNIGTISSGAITTSGLLTVGSGAGAIKINESFITARSSDNANDINLIANINVFDADDVVIGSTSGQRFNDNIVFRTNGSQALRLDSSQNATFAGTISGTLASSVTATTQSAGDNSTKVATTAYTDTAIANLVDGAPSTLNTLNEIAAALNDDAALNTTLTNSIATKLPLAGGTMTGTLNMGSQNITNIQNIRANDIDFIVQDTTDSTTNFIWRDHSASKLYLGTADAVVNIRSNLDLNDNSISNVAEVRTESLFIDSGGFSPSDDEGKEFKYYLVGQGTDQNFKKVADVTISTGNYKALALRVVLESQAGNFGNTIAVDKTEYVCNFYRSAASQDSEDTAVISGQDPTHHNLRIVKTATGVYELQVRQNANYKDAILKLEVLSTNGGTFTVTDGNVNGSTSGTITTPTSVESASTYSFNKVDTPFLNIQNSIKVNSTQILDSARNLSNIGTISSGNITSSGTGSFSNLVNALAYQVSGTQVISSARNLENIGTISSGAITSSGVVTATSGSGHRFGRLTLRDDSIEEQQTNTDTATVAISYNGYAGGTTKFRDFAIFDGKQQAVARFDGSDKTLNVVSGYQLNGTTVIDSSRNLTNIGTVSCGAITSSGNMLVTANSSSNHSFEVKRASDGSQALRINATGEVVVSNNYLYASNSGTSFYSEGDAVFRATIRNDQSGMPVKVSDDFNVTGAYQSNGTTIIDSSRNLANIGTYAGSGDITLTSGSNQVLLAVTNGALEITRSAGGPFIDFKNSTSDDFDSRIMGGDALIFSTGGNGSTATALTLGSDQNATFAGSIITSKTSEAILLDSAHSKTKIGLFGGIGTGAEYIGTSANTVEISGTNINFNGASGSGTPNLKMGTTTVIDSSRNLTNIGNIGSTKYNINSEGGGTLFQTDGYLRFANGNTETARIDGSGNLNAINGIQINGTEVISGGRNLTNIAGISTAAGAVMGHGFTGGSRGFNFESGDENVGTIRFDANTMRFWSGGAGGGNERIRINDAATDNGDINFYGAIDLEGVQLRVSGTTVIDGSRNLTNIGTIACTNITCGNVTPSGEIFLGNAKEINFAKADGSNDGTKIERFSGNALRFRYTGNSCIFDSLGNNPFSIRNSNDSVIFEVSPNSTHANSTTNINNGVLQIAGTTVINGSRNLTNIGTISSKDITATQSSDAATNLTLKRNSATGRAQFALANESGSQLWRVGLTGSGGDDFVFYDGGANVLILDRGTNNATFAGDITAFSDERLKDNIQTLDGKKALQMRGVSFIRDGKEGSGVIAQEIEKIAPELVATADDEQGTKSVAYGNLVGYLIEAIKEQQDQIEYMKSEIKTLKEANNGNK